MAPCCAICSRRKKTASENCLHLFCYKCGRHTKTERCFHCHRYCKRNRNGLLKENETEETMETDEQHCERECVAEVTNAKKSRIVTGTDEQMEDTITSSLKCTTWII